MNDITTLHRQAMRAAELAEVARIEGDEETAQGRFKEAYSIERRAAELVANRVDYEPTRSVLLRSAASLALECGEWREAERLVAVSLAGNPPEAIAEELRDLSEQIYFSRHLELRGVALAPGEFQMALAGNAVGFGIAPSDAVIERVAQAERMLVRIAERRARRPFREGGSASRDIRDAVSLFMSVPRAASYAVTFRVGRPKEQLDMPEVLGTTELVNDMFECLELFANDKMDELRERIPDEAYFNNFTALAKQIAPDGDDITVVGFTSEGDGHKREIALRPKRFSFMAKPARQPTQPNRSRRITGRLLFADERQGANTIRLVDADSVEHKIAVPPGMMSDIVKPLWHDLVTVTGTLRYSTIHLEDISRAEVPESDGDAANEA